MVRVIAIVVGLVALAFFGAPAAGACPMNPAMVSCCCDSLELAHGFGDASLGRPDSSGGCCDGACLSFKTAPPAHEGAPAVVVASPAAVAAAAPHAVGLPPAPRPATVHRARLARGPPRVAPRPLYLTFEALLI